MEMAVEELTRLSFNKEEWENYSLYCMERDPICTRDKYEKYCMKQRLIEVAKEILSEGYQIEKVCSLFALKREDIE